MRIEIGKRISAVEILEIIKNNLAGEFVAEGNMIYLENVKTPMLTQRPQSQPITQYPSQQYTVQPTHIPQKGAFSRMGDQLNEMCGL
jgi:hypothetical protein